MRSEDGVERHTIVESSRMESKRIYRITAGYGMKRITMGFARNSGFAFVCAKLSMQELCGTHGLWNSYRCPGGATDSRAGEPEGELSQD